MCGGIGVGGAQKHISVAPCGVVAKPLTAEYRESMATKENPSQRCLELSPISGYRPLRAPLGSRSSTDRERGVQCSLPTRTCLPMYQQASKLRSAQLARSVVGALCGDWAPGSARLMSRLRLANLSYTQLLELAVDACKSSPELKHKADALIAKGRAAPIVVRGCLAVAGPAAPALQLARAVRARSRRRMHHLVACLQQAAAEVPLRQPKECATAGWCAHEPGWPLHAARRRGGDHLVRAGQQRQRELRRCAQRFRPTSAGGLPGQQSRRTAFRVALGHAPTTDSWCAASSTHPPHCTSLLRTGRWMSWQRCLRLPVMTEGSGGVL